MLSDSPIHISNGNLTSGIETDESIQAVIDFIRTNFNDFAKDKRDLKDTNEKGISQQLCIFLNRRASKYPFFFHSEFMEDVTSGTSAQVDIGTISRDEKIVISDNEYGEDDSFFSIETKRLPTPGSDREKEYVIGHSKPCGGIERFKKGIHGSRLKYAAIIGYIQNNNFDYWFLTINSWINELIKEDNNNFWNNEDALQKLQEQNSNLITELLSYNLRRRTNFPDDKIMLYHFWINFTDE